MKSISLRIIPASLVFLPFIIACGADPITSDTPTNPVVSVRSDLEANAYPADKDGSQIPTAPGLAVDSLEVTSASIIFSDLKLHGLDYESQESVGTLRVGQFLMVFEPQGKNYVSDVEVLAGTYPQMKFEVHPLHGDLDSLLRTDNRFSDFVTLGPTNSVIIHGHTYKNGVKVPFVYTSVLTMNGQYFFNPPLVLDGGTQTELRVRFLAQTAFSTEGAVLDPSDVRNRTTIENNLRSSIGVFRL